MGFRKATLTLVVGFFACMTVAVSAPLALEKNLVVETGLDTAGVSQKVETEIVAASQATAFALVSNKPASELMERKSTGGIMNSVPFSPALILFGAALGAIFWLGRRRKSENSGWQ